MISRVFQKNTVGGGGAAVSGASGGSKKGMRASTGGSSSMSLCGSAYEPGSPASSSIYLPPLMESSPYTATSSAATSAALFKDGDSFDSVKREHVSCFSTINNAAGNNNSFSGGGFDLAPLAVDPFSRFQRNVVGVSAFPSLRSLQENLQMPFFFSPPAAQPMNADVAGCGNVGNWPVMEEHVVSDGGSGMPVGASELDCMWGY